MHPLLTLLGLYSITEATSKDVSLDRVDQPHLQLIVSPSQRTAVTETRGCCGEATLSHKRENDGR
jgi:hypothetical protein